MKNTTTFKDLIQALLDGATEGVSATNTLRIVGNQLVHYKTPIAERFDGKVIVNNARYSLATGRLQKQVRAIVPYEQQVIVKGVPIGYKGSLCDYVTDR